MDKKQQLLKEITTYLENGFFPDIFSVVIKDSFRFEHSEKELKVILRFLKTQMKLAEGLK
ncbi:MAG: hypothetical protein AAB526_02485 [Patescibacteria group bacterium]